MGRVSAHPKVNPHAGVRIRAARLQSGPSLSTEKLKSVLRNTLLCGKVAEWAESQHDQSRYRILAPARGCGEVAEWAESQHRPAEIGYYSTRLECAARVASEARAILIVTWASYDGREE